VLVEAHLLPGGLIRNDHGDFICRDQGLRVENAALGATAQTSGLVVPRRRRAVPGRSYMTTGAVCDGLD